APDSRASVTWKSARTRTASSGPRQRSAGTGTNGFETGQSSSGASKQPRCASVSGCESTTWEWPTASRALRRRSNGLENSMVRGRTLRNHAPVAEKPEPIQPRRATPSSSCRRRLLLERREPVEERSAVRTVQRDASGARSSLTEHRATDHLRRHLL